MNSFDALQTTNAIRHHRNNIGAWKFRQNMFGEDWTKAIEHAEKQVAELETALNTPEAE